MNLSLDNIKRALKAAKVSPDGSGHFIMQRLSALALVVLTFFLIISFVAMAKAESMEALQGTLGNPLLLIGLILFVPIGFYHGVLGVHVVVDDYIRCNVMKKRLMLVTKIAAFCFAGLLLFSILKIAL